MSISIPGARLVSPEEARATIELVLKPHLNAKDLLYALDRELCLDDEYDRRGVLELPDGAVIDGDLVLDFDAAEYEGKRYRGVVGLGQLTIKGDILAENPDAGPFLAVCGGLDVRQIIKGGAPMIVGGRLTAAGLVFCFYNNHGRLRALGGLKAQGLVVDDQKIDIKKPIEVPIKALKARAFAEVLVADLLSEDEDGKFVPMDDVGAEIIARMKAGRPVLR
jgi:hypothetical protein